MNRCRSCRQTIRWALTERGRPIPIDPEPRPDGNLELVYIDRVLVARTITPEREQELELQLLEASREGREPVLPLHVSHFATCPQADIHRRRANAPGGAA